MISWLKEEHEISSNVNEIIRAILNFLFYFYKKISQAQKLQKGHKAQKTKKARKRK